MDSEHPTEAHRSYYQSSGQGRSLVQRQFLERGLGIGKGRGRDGGGGGTVYGKTYDSQPIRHESQGQCTGAVRTEADEATRKKAPLQFVPRIHWFKALSPSGDINTLVVPLRGGPW